MKIVVIGVGTSGCNVAEYLQKENTHDEVSFAMVDSHFIASQDYTIESRVSLGRKSIGLGHGYPPQKYKELALKKRDEIKKLMQ